MLFLVRATDPVTPLVMSPEMRFPVLFPSKARVLAKSPAVMPTGPVMKMFVSFGLSVEVPAAPEVMLKAVKLTEGVPLVTLLPLARVSRLLPQKTVPSECWKAAPAVARFSVRVLAALLLPSSK